MVHVLHVNTFYAPHVKGGAELMTQLQAELMLKKGGRASVLCTRDGSGVDRVTRNGVRIWRAGIRNLYWQYNGWPKSSFKRKLWHFIDIFNPFVIRLVRRVLTEAKPDIVVCHNLMGWSPAVWAVTRSMKIPLVQILHDQYLLCGRSTMRRNGQNCTRRCAVCRMIRAPHQWLSTNVTAVVGVSDFVLTRFLEYGYFRKTPVKRVIYNIPSGVSVPETHVGPPCPRENGKVRFGFMGRLDEAKGIRLLLETFSEGEFDRSRLVVAGSLDSEFSRDLEQKYGNRGNIQFVGHVRPLEFYRDIDVLVVPSLWNDTLPTVVLEAMQYGLPVIASNLGGIPEMIDDGKTGWLFDPEMPGQLKDRMLMMDHDLLSGVAPAVREKAGRFVDHDRFVREYTALYADVMALNS